ncbi:MAG: TauD/TfdA family dioxygenase [Pseudomonadota bacterium]
MSSVQELNYKDNAVYEKLAERAKANKPPTRSAALGAVAASRSPDANTHEEMRDSILAQDRELVAGNFGTVNYKPAYVCGIELKLEPLQPSIGTIVHGIDLATDLNNPEMVTFLRNLWLERRVIMFRDQNHLSREQMRDFAKHFGEIGTPYGEREHVPNSPHDLSNQIEVPDIPEMLVLASDEAATVSASGWHSDATWQPRPPMGSVLMSREAPPIGGDTCFCDCYSMWEGLPLAVKQRVERLKAVHVGAIIHQMDGKTPVVEHPVARTHPETGRTVLYVQQGFVRSFAKEHNIPEEEEKALLLQMKLQEGRPEYTCRFKWETGSIAMWDNRAVLHYASGDFWPHRRLMERLTILDYEKSRRTPYYTP